MVIVAFAAEEDMLFDNVVDKVALEISVDMVACFDSVIVFTNSIELAEVAVLACSS